MSTRDTTVCLDWGGVILRICSSFQQAAARAGLELRSLPNTADCVHERTRLAHAYETGALACDEFFERLSHAVEGTYTPEELRAIHDAWLIGEYSGVHSLIDDLLAAGMHTVLLSNTNPRHYRRSLDGDFPAIQRLHVRLLSHELEVAKPDPRAFAHVQHACNSARIIYFDDRPEHVAAGRTAGLIAHRIDPDGDPPAQIRTVLADLGVLDP